jgi:GT2 family glycosyltransferase
VGPRIYYHNKSRKIWHGGGYFSLLKSGIINPEKNKYDEQCDNNIRRVNFLTGCALIIRRNVFEKIGLFDENYFLYEEDVDLCIRANRAGFELYYNPAAKVWHKILSIARDRTSSFVMYNMAINHILLLRKNFSTGYFIYGLFLHFMFFTPFRIYKIMTGSQSWQAVFAWFHGSLKTLL